MFEVEDIEVFEDVGQACVGLLLNRATDRIISLNITNKDGDAFGKLFK